MHIFNNINTHLFQEAISKNFINNISKHTCQTLANIISIDYSTRLNSKPKVEQHINDCVYKLKKYLGKRVITDDSFSVALTLFVVAITPEDVTTQKQNTILIQAQDRVIENLITEHFGSNNDINYEERKKITAIFESLFSEKNIVDILNYIHADPQLFRTSILYAVKKYHIQNERNIYIRTEINKMLTLKLELDAQATNFKQITSNITTAICALSVGALSVITAGAIFSLIVIPSAICSIKYAPKIGEILGQIILNQDGNIKAKMNDIKAKMNDIKALHDSAKENNLAFLSQSKTAVIDTSKTIVVQPMRTKEITTGKHSSNQRSM